MDCKNKSVDVSLVHCAGEGASLTNTGPGHAAAPWILMSLCFLIASLIKAMKYCGNLDSEKPIFFETVSAAISNMHLNKVSWTSWCARIIRKLECRIKGFVMFILDYYPIYIWKPIKMCPLLGVLCSKQRNFFIPFLDNVWTLFKNLEFPAISLFKGSGDHLLSANCLIIK